MQLYLSSNISPVDFDGKDKEAQHVVIMPEGHSGQYIAV